MEEARRNYSRSEWSNLSIQDRIKAMNDTLDHVEETSVTVAELSGEEIDEPEFDEPPPRMSVIDMWRSRENTPKKAEDSGKTPISAKKLPFKKPPVPSEIEEKKEDDSNHVVSSSTASAADSIKNFWAQKTKTSSPSVGNDDQGSSRTSSSMTQSEPSVAKPKILPLNSNILDEPVDLTIVPSNDENAVESPKKQNGLFAIVDSSADDLESLSPDQPESDTPKRRSVVDVWKSKKTSAHNGEDEQELVSPSVVRPSEVKNSLKSSSIFGAHEEEADNISDVRSSAGNGSHVISSPLRSSETPPTPSKLAKSFQFPVNSPASTKPVVRHSPVSSEKQKTPFASSPKPPSSSPFHINKIKGTPDTASKAKLPIPKKNKMVERWESRIHGQESVSGSDVPVVAESPKPVAVTTNGTAKDRAETLGTDMTEEKKTCKTSLNISVPPISPKSDVVYGSTSPRARHRKPSSGDFPVEDVQPAVIEVPQSPRTKDIAKELNERVKKNGAALPSPRQAAWPVTSFSATDPPATVPAVNVQEEPRDKPPKDIALSEAKLHRDVTNATEGLSIPALSSSSVSESENSRFNMTKEATAISDHTSRKAKVSRLSRKLGVRNSPGGSGVPCDPSDDHPVPVEARNTVENARIPDILAEEKEPESLPKPSKESKMSAPPIKTSSVSAFDTVTSTRKKSEARQHFLQLGLKHRAPRAITPTNENRAEAAGSKTHTDGRPESKNQDQARPDVRKVTEQTSSSVSRQQESLVLKKKRLEEQKKRLKTCLSDDPDEQSMVEQVEVITKEGVKVKPRGGLSNEIAGFSELTSFDPTPTNNWVAFPGTKASDAALMRVSSENGANDAGFTFLDGQSTFSGYSGISRNSSNVSGSSFARRAEQKILNRRMRKKAIEAAPTPAASSNTEKIKTDSAVLRDNQKSRAQEEYLYNRYKTSDRFVDSSSRLSDSDIRSALQKVPSSETHSLQRSAHSREYTDGEESTTMESVTTASATSSFHSRGHRAGQRKSGLASEEFLTESSQNFNAFASACTSVTMSQLAKDWASEMEMSAKNMKSLALGMIKPLTAYTGTETRPDDTRQRKTYNRKYEEPAPFDEESTAIEVEFMESEDDPSRDLVPCFRPVDLMINNADQSCSKPHVGDTPAGQPSFEEATKKKRRSNRIK